MFFYIKPLIKTSGLSPHWKKNIRDQCVGRGIFWAVAHNFKGREAFSGFKLLSSLVHHPGGPGIGNMVVGPGVANAIGG